MVPDGPRPPVSSVPAVPDGPRPASSVPVVPDARWLPALRRALGPVDVVQRSPLTGGYVSPAVERVELSSGDVVVLKAASDVEVAAMRALAAVPGAEPRALASGPGWLVVPWVAGAPPADGEPVPEAVWQTLARVHGHWAGRSPAGVPVVDAGWWARLVDRTLVAVRGGAARTGEAAYAAAERALVAWRADRAVRAALAVLPRTLTHGDAHRGNVLGSTLIDWGNARIAPAGLDLATLRAQGGVPPSWFAVPSPVESSWADVQVNVQYLGFAADHLGPARVAEMVEAAAAARSRLAALVATRASPPRPPPYGHI